MNAEIMRERLRDYIENVDEDRLQKLFLSIEDELPAQQFYELSDDDIEYLDERRELHINGMTESYTWGEVREMIRQKRGI